MLYRHRLELKIQRQRPWQGLSGLGKVFIRGSASSLLCFMHYQHELHSDKKENIVDT
jgi:hypothetical protein